MMSEKKKITKSVDRYHDEAKVKQKNFLKGRLNTDQHEFIVRDERSLSRENQASMVDNGTRSRMSHTINNLQATKTMLSDTNFLKEQSVSTRMTNMPHKQSIKPDSEIPTKSMIKEGVKGVRS